MKSVLVIGPLFYDYSKSVGRAFEQHGFKVEVYDSWMEGISNNLIEKVRYYSTANKEKFLENLYEKFNKEIKEIYDRMQPDLVFIIRGAILTAETLNYMKSSKLQLWMMDSIFRAKNTLKNVALYDHVFLFEKEDILPLKEQHGVDGIFLPLALDESVYFPIETDSKPIDLLFTGWLYPNRIALLKKIIKRFPDKNIQIYGFYFSKLRNPFRHWFRNDKKHFTNASVTPAELNVLYSQSKVCLNIHHSQSQYGVNQRFFEICGARSLQICDSHGFITDNFKSNEVLIYNTENELFDLIESAFNDYNSFASNVESSYNSVKSHHTFKSRIKFVLATISEAATNV